MFSEIGEEPKVGSCGCVLKGSSPSSNELKKKVDLDMAPAVKNAKEKHYLSTFKVFCWRTGLGRGGNCSPWEDPLENHILGFPGGAVVDNPPANAEGVGSSPGPGRAHMPRGN